MADDTGLEVDALGGAPGVSPPATPGEDATYADNVAKLLARWTVVADRRARFARWPWCAFPDGRRWWPRARSRA